MDWNAKVDELISQLSNDESELFNQLANDAWFNRTLDDESCAALAKALADKFSAVNDPGIKGLLLRLMGWADSHLACEVAMSNLEGTASASLSHAQYLYETILAIARERFDLFSTFGLSSINLPKSLRLAFALLREKPILDGDCLEADERSNAEFSDFLSGLLKR
jgi:hypothetical protein